MTRALQLVHSLPPAALDATDFNRIHVSGYCFTNWRQFQIILVVTPAHHWYFDLYFCNGESETVWQLTENSYCYRHIPFTREVKETFLHIMWMACSKVHRTRYHGMCSAEEKQKYLEQHQNKITDISLHHLTKIDSWWPDNNLIRSQ